MIRALYTAASGMEAQQTNIDVISNNLANTNTTAFKASSLQFQDLMYQTDRAPGAKNSDGTTSPTGIQIGFGVKKAATSLDFTQGELATSSSKLDLAIEGNGFFQVQRPDGSFAYTRDGSFKRDAQGNVVTNSGYKVVGIGQIDPTIASENITISPDGSMSVTTTNGQIQQLSPVTLCTFPNPQGLLAIGENLYQETEGSGVAVTGQTPATLGIGSIAQGYTEGSNVSVVTEMVKMIQAQRAYEVNSKSITTSDQMMSMADNMKAG